MKTVIYNLTILSFLLMASIINAQTKETVFIEDFESGWGSWWADNGVWDVGAPTFGSVVPHAGQTCVGTVLNDNYPNYADTRLVSPEINLPNITGDEKIQLKFWHWFDIENENDQGVVQISVNSGNWQTISNPEFDGMSMVWTQYIADFSAFAGASVKIAFYFTSDYYWNYAGWYIDDIRIEGIIGVDINEVEIGVPIIYPNPLLDKTTIKFNNPNQSNYTLSVFSTAGNKVFEQDNITSGQVEFEKGNLKPGVYLFKLNGEKVYRGKLVIEKIIQ